MSSTWKTSPRNASQPGGRRDDDDISRYATDCCERTSWMVNACVPLSKKYSRIAQPEYGARNCRGAGSALQSGCFGIAIQVYSLHFTSRSTSLLGIWEQLIQMYVISHSLCRQDPLSDVDMMMSEVRPHLSSLPLLSRERIIRFLWNQEYQLLHTWTYCE